MRTIGEIIKLSGEFLKIERGKRIAEELIAHALGMRRMDLYLQYDRPVVESELTTIREMLKRCAKNEPPEYVMGQVEFYGCQIRVDPRVLIPRQETEILVEKIANVAKEGVLWDLCTGSGCIGIALKKANPALQVTLSDVSPEALALASQNARLNHVEVSVLQGDLLEPFQGKRADFIVCNPPYLSEEEYRELDPSVRDFEPKLALVAGVDGAEFYERLEKLLGAYLNPGGQFFFEIGSTQGAVLKALFPKSQIEKDWAGHPRFLVAQIADL